MMKATIDWTSEASLFLPMGKGIRNTRMVVYTATLVPDTPYWNGVKVESGNDSCKMSELQTYQYMKINHLRTLPCIAQLYEWRPLNPSHK